MTLSQRNKKVQLCSTRDSVACWSRVGPRIVLLANNYNLGRSESCLEQMKIPAVIKDEWSWTVLACPSFKMQN
jgi:hypothetical protein